MKNFNLFIAIVAIFLGVSSCSSDNESNLAAQKTVYLVRTQELVNMAYTYKYNPFFILIANNNLVSVTCSVNNESSKMKRLTEKSFFSDYNYNTPFELINNMIVQFILKDEDGNSLTLSDEISNITDNMGYVNLKKLEYKSGVIKLTYDETENASEYVLTVREYGDSYRYSHPLTQDDSYNLSDLDYPTGTKLQVCLSAINAKGTVQADSPSYVITVGTDFSTEYD